MDLHIPSVADMGPKPIPASAHYHVINHPRFHPNNLWERRPDGLYVLAGSVYALPEGNIKPCTAQH